jgi:hypothetical protein
MVSIDLRHRIANMPNMYGSTARCAKLHKLL